MKKSYKIYASYFFVEFALYSRKEKMLRSLTYTARNYNKRKFLNIKDLK